VMRICSYLLTSPCNLMRIQIRLHFDADPDLAFQFDADPDPTFTLMRIRIQLFTQIRIRDSLLISDANLRSLAYRHSMAPGFNEPYCTPGATHVNVIP
jgi:hypothetical protein